MRVLSTELYDQGMENLIKEFLLGLEGEPQNKLISPSDANVLVRAHTDPYFGEVMSSYEYNIPDGVPSVWVGRMKGAKNMTRCAGIDLFERVLEQTKDRDIKHYFIGGMPEVLEKIRIRVETGIGNPNIVGMYSPPYKEFTEAEIKEMAQTANDLKADIIWVGLGTPKQQIFSKLLSQYTQAYYIAPVGAAFDFMAGTVKKAPEWLQKMGLEWAYRILTEPKRLGKRYLNVVPRFIWFQLLDFLNPKPN